MNYRLYLLLLLFIGSMYAQEYQEPEALDSVFIDAKIPRARKNSGKVVVTLDAEDLQQQPGRSVADLLNDVSGFEINGSRSNEGQNLGYFVRGGRNRQVVIMIDGVQQNDPSSIANDYDLRLLPSSAVESIEIVKGASSVLYGSGAATAVIQIRTRKISGKPVRAVFTSTVGTNKASEDKVSGLDEFTNYVNLSGSLNRFQYSLDFNSRNVDGLSAVEAPEGSLAFESDEFNRYNTTARLGYRFSDKVEISRFFSLDDFTSEFDDFSYMDADNLSNSRQLRTGGRFRWKYNKGSLVINDGHSWLDREISSSFPTMFDSQSSTFDAFANYNFSNRFNVLLGINGNFSSFNSFSIPFGETDFSEIINEDTARFDIIDPYANVTYVSAFGLDLNAGVRFNFHSDYGNHLVYNFNPSYRIDLGKGLLKLLASYSTAFITPSLFQLYDPQFGNVELEPEENATVEVGAEYTIGGSTRASAVYFSRNEKNFVDFVTVDPENFLFQYQNVADEFKASGLEFEIRQDLGKHFRINGNYTYTRADDRFSLRIPESKANASLLYKPVAKLDLRLSYQYVSERDDVFFDPDTFESTAVVLNSYDLLNLDVNYRVNEVLRVFADFSNIFNTEFEELYRFQTRGSNFRIGLSLTFE